MSKAAEILARMEEQGENIKITRRELGQLKAEQERMEREAKSFQEQFHNHPERLKELELKQGRGFGHVQEEERATSSLGGFVVNLEEYKEFRSSSLACPQGKFNFSGSRGADWGNGSEKSSTNRSVLGDLVSQRAFLREHAQRDFIANTAPGLANGIIPNQWSSEIIYNPFAPKRFLERVGITTINPGVTQYPREITFKAINVTLANAVAALDTTAVLKNVNGLIIGRAILFDDNSNSESLTITNIDYDTQTVTFSSGFVNAFAAGTMGSSDQFNFVEEGDLAPEAAFLTENKQFNARTIRVAMAVTEELLNDAPAFEAYLQARLPNLLLDQISRNAIYGDGSTRQMNGLLADPDVQVYNWSDGLVGDTRIDAILQGRCLVNTANYTSNTFMTSPLTWCNVIGTKDGNQNYQLGGPGVIANRIWTLDALEDNAFVNTDSVVGQFDPGTFQIWETADLELSFFNQHKDFAARNLVYVLAKWRGNTVITQPQAFCNTNLDSAPV